MAPDLDLDSLSALPLFSGLKREEPAPVRHQLAVEHCAAGTRVFQLAQLVRAVLATVRRAPGSWSPPRRGAQPAGSISQQAVTRQIRAQPHSAG
jgi:hypothetical protein